MVIMNLMQVIFTFVTLSTGSIGLLMYIIEPYLPKFLTRTYRFGKFAEKAEHPFVVKCEVPKRWFKHFYIFAAPFAISVLIIAINRYFLGGNVPQILYNILDLLLGPRRRALVSSECTLIALILITIQCCKRLYETHYISIFSDAKINLLHYLLGYIHYAGVILCIVGESDGFIKGKRASFNWNNITYADILIAIVFISSSYAQLRCNYILANLRKNDKAVVVSKSYKIPHGELFEYVSSPLQFTEILMYVCLSFIMRSSTSCHFVTSWVIANQTSCAVFSQEWYHQTFKNYPKTRKTLVPFLF